jgi:hypothetical protein
VGCTAVAKGMLWYGFDSRRDGDALLEALRSHTDAIRGEDGDHRSTWFGQVSLRYEEARLPNGADGSLVFEQGWL